MSNPELPDEPQDIDPERVSWAASFLADWIIPLIQEGRIETADEIVELRKHFQPEAQAGKDFTMEDCWWAIVRWHKRRQQYDLAHPDFPIGNRAEFDKALTLIRTLVNPFPKIDSSPPHIDDS